MRNSLIVIFVILLSVLRGNAQQYPTSATVIMTPPHPVYINDYYGIGSTAFQTILNLNDLNEVTWDVRLRITVEGEGIRLESKYSYIPPVPITLTSGIPTTLSGSDFAGYFNVNNLNLEGITEATLNQSGKLPEGLYNFCVEILDYNSGKPISGTSCQSVFIFFEPPPVLLQPACENIVTPSNPQNVYFAWQIAGGASPTIAMNSKYNMKLYEVTDNNDDPYFAVENNHALLVFESGFTNNTSVNLDYASGATTPLIAGKKYVWRVRAVDADEKNIYRNDGFSEWCWFYYGYPSDGVIELQSPEEEHIFGKYDNKSFNWSASSLGVPGQEYDYSIIIKQLNPDQDMEVAMDVNPVWYEEYFPTTTSLNGYGMNLSQEFEPGTTYVWQIVAHTEAQEVARSEVRKFYAPSLLDEFDAGGTKVKIVTLEGNDLSDASGKGRVQLTDDPADVVEFDFEHLNIEDMAGEMVLVGGEVTFDLSDRDSIKMPARLSENGDAHLHYIEGKLNTEGLKFKSQMVWQFPHATTDNQVRYVVSEANWLSVGEGSSVNGELKLANKSEYELLELFEFNMTLEKTSKFTIVDGEYVLSLNGNLASNDEVRTNDGLPFAVSFSNVDQLYYVELQNLTNSSANYLEPVEGFGLGFYPINGVLDMSETESPGKLSGNTPWKGVYVSSLLARFKMDGIDATNQLSTYADIDRNVQLSGATEFWLSNQGLHCAYEFDLDEEGTTFNGFATTLQGTLNIDNNEVSSSSLTGSIRLPVIHKTEEFSFQIPIANEGLKTGYLNEDLTTRELVFNAFGGENRVDVTINRAVFADNERIDLEIDADLIGIDATVSGIEDFRIYGNNMIGIGGVNGALPLTNQVAGEYKGFAAQVISVGAAMHNGNYVFSYETEIDMGPGVVGQDGPPILAVSSVEPVGSSVSLPEFSPSSPAPEPTIAVPDDIEEGESQLTVKEMFIEIDNPMAKVAGYLKLTNNDPNWGTSFRGGINGKLKIPAEIDMGSNIIFGDREGTKFWYFDAYFNDKSGLGIQVPPYFNIVALEGRAYHHMSKQEGEYVVDPDMAFGMGMYLQLIDNAQQGALFAIDAGAELKIETSGNFIFSMNGNAAFLNVNRRSGSASSSVAGDVAQEAVNEVMEAVGPIEFSQEIAGGTLTVKAETLTAGEMSYAKDDYTFTIGGDVGGTPAASFAFEKGDSEVSFGASASGDFDVNFAQSGNNIGLGIEGGSGGYLDFNYDNISVASQVDIQKKTGSLAFGYDDKSIKVGKTSEGGYFDLQLSEDIAFNTGFDQGEQSGYLGMKYGSNEFGISGNNSTGEGAIKLKVDGVGMDFNVNTEEKSGAFSLDVGSTSVAVAAEAEKSGSFSFSTGSVSGAIAVDLEAQTGLLEYSYDQGNKSFHASVDEGTTGKLEFSHDDVELKMFGSVDGANGGISVAVGGDKFEIEGDKQNGTGKILYDIGDDYFLVDVQSDSGSVQFKTGNVDFTVGMTDQGSGALITKVGDKELNIYGSVPSQVCAVSVKDGSDEYAMSTDLQNSNHAVKINSGSTGFEASYSETSQAVEFNQGEDLGVYAKNEDGNYEVGTSYQGHKVSAAMIADVMSISYEGSGVDMTLSEEEISFSYSGHSLYVSETEFKVDGSTLEQLSRSLTYSHTEDIDGVRVTFSIDNGDLEFEIENGGKTITLGTNLDFDEGNLELAYDGETYKVYKLGEKYGVEYQDYAASYEDGTVELSKGTGKKLTVSESALGVTYDDYEIEVTESSFTYSDGTNSASFSDEEMKLARNDQELYISDDEFGIKLATDKSLVLTKSSAEIEYGDYKAGFGTEGYVHYSDATRNLSLSAEGLELGYDDKSLALLNDDGVPGIKLVDRDDSFEVSRKGFAIEYDGRRYAISEEEDLKIDLDDDKHLLLKSNGASYVQGEASLNIGGDDNYLELKYSDHSIALTQDDKIQYTDDTYTAWLSKDLEAFISDGDQSIGLFSESHYLTYEYGDYGFGIRGGSAGEKMGVDVTVSGNTFYVEGERNSEVTIGVESTDFGDASLSVDASKNFAARFKDVNKVYGFKKVGDLIVPITGTEPEDPEPEYLAGSGSVEAMDGPQYLDNSIADDAGGSIKGKAEMSFNSATKHLVANAAVEGNKPVCIKGALALQIKPNLFKLDVGTQQERVELYPTCTGFGGGGWLGIEATPSNLGVNVGVFYGWKMKSSIGIGNDACGAGLTFEASAEIGARAIADLYPNFSIHEAEIWLELYAALKAGYWCAGVSGDFTLAAVGIKGNLLAKFYDNTTNLSGNLSGYINILEIIEEDFSIGFNLNI